MNPRVFLFAAALASLAAAAENPADRDPIERQHHAALKEKDREIEALKADARLWRARAEQCREMGEPKKAAPAPDLGGSRAPLDR